MLLCAKSEIAIFGSSMSQKVQVLAQATSQKIIKAARTFAVGAGLAALAACTNMAQVGPAAVPLSAEEQLALQEARGVGVYLAARQAEANFDYVRASQLFQKVLAENPDNGEVLSRSFFAALYAGQWMKAQELAQKIVARAPSAGVSRLLLAVADMSQGNYDRIIAGVDKDDDGTAILLEPVVLAWAYAGKGDKENAIGALQTLAQDGGGLHFYGLHTALIYDYLGEDEDAYKAYLNLLRLGGNGTRVAQAIGRFLERYEEEDSAGRFYQLYLEQVGRDSVIQREYDQFQEGAEKPRLIATPSQGLAEALYFAAYALSGEPRAYKVAQLYLQLSLFADPNAQQSMLFVAF